MGIRSVFIILLIACGALFVGSLFKQEQAVRTVPSDLGFDETVQVFEKRLADGGFKVLARWDQALPEEEYARDSLVYVFGRPSGVDAEGWTLVDDPKTVLIWSSEEGQTLLSTEWSSLDTDAVVASLRRSEADTKFFETIEMQPLVANIGPDELKEKRAPGPPASPSGLSVAQSD